MPEQPSVADTLRVVRGFLRLARKAVVDARHIEAMIEIDTLMQIAQIEAERQIAVLERAPGASRKELSRAILGRKTGWSGTHSERSQARHTASTALSLVDGFCLE